MTWLTPLTGAVVAAVVVPALVALYFLRLRRRKRAVSSTLLWLRAVEDLRANTPFQRLRFSILLILQLLAVALIVLAIMQPQADLGERRGGRTAILIDRSASMASMEDGVTRLDAAKRRAKELVEALFSGGIFAGSPGEVMVIAFAGSAQVVAPFTDSRSQLLASIDAIEQTDEATQIGEALALARAFTQAGDAASLRRQDAGPQAEPATLEVFSDGRIEDLAEQALMPGERLTFHRVGGEGAGNLAVATLGAARVPDDPSKVAVYARIANYAGAPATTDVQLAVDGRTRALLPEPVELPAAVPDPVTGGVIPGMAQVAFPPLELPQGGILSVRALAEDALATDNEARLVAPPSKPLRVLLVGDGGFLLRSLLEGMPLDRLERASAAQFAAMDPASVESFDAVVLDGVTLPSLPRGRYLTFGPPPPLPGLNPFAEASGARLRLAKDDHPLLRMARLDDVVVGTLHRIAPSSDIEVVAEADAGPLLVVASRGATQAIVVPFHPLDSNWPFLRSFVNFMANALEYLGASGEVAATRPLAPGDVLSTRLPPGATGIVVHLPGGGEAAVAPQDPALVAWGPARLAGNYAISWGGAAPGTRRFAVNIRTDPESHIAAAEGLQLRSERVRGVAESGAVRTNLWPWALGAALAVLLLEWWVWFRRL